MLQLMDPSSYSFGQVKLGTFSDATKYIISNFAFVTISFNGFSNKYEIIMYDA